MENKTPTSLTGTLASNKKLIPLKTPREIVALASFFGKQTDSIFDEKYVVKRDAVIMTGDNVEQVIDADTAQMATDSLAEVSDMLSDVEECRVKTKEPFWNICQKIQQDVKKFTLPLETVQRRLKGLLGTYHAKIEREAQQAREAQAAEQARIEEEQRKLEEESKRKLAEATAAISQAAKTGDVAQAQIAQKALVQSQQAAALQSASLQHQAERNAMPIEVEVPQGMKVRKRWTFKVKGTTDAEKFANLRLALEARPEFFNIEPKKLDINKAIDTAKKANLEISIPGLEVIEDVNIGA